MAPDQEARRYPRLNHKIGITVHEVPGAVEGLSPSGHGLSFRHATAVAVGTALHLDLRVPVTETPIAVDGIVRWCRAATDGNGFEIGVEFTTVNATLNDWVARALVKGLSDGPGDGPHSGAAFRQQLDH